MPNEWALCLPTGIIFFIFFNGPVRMSDGPPHDPFTYLLNRCQNQYHDCSSQLRLILPWH
jgi:hypothetical protein